MSVQPTGTIIPTPTIPPGSDTLTDIATVISSNDPHLAYGGAYETVCGSGVMIGGNYPCAPINMNRGLGDLTWVPGVPGTVFTGLQCLGPMDLAEMQAAAMKNNDARVNRTIQDNLIGGFIPISEFEVRTATEAGGLADADTIARCEYTGQGVIHIHPALAEQWMGKEIIRVGRHLETVMGAMVSLNCWLPVDQIAVTGWLTVLKGASRVLDPYHDVAGPGSDSGAPLNLWYVNVQTPVTVFNDCNLAVLIGGVEGGGPPPVVGPITVTEVIPNTIAIDEFVTLQINGTGFSKTSVVYVNNQPVPGTVYYNSTLLGASFLASEFFPIPGSPYPVEVSGSDDTVPVSVTAPLKDVSYTIAPPSGQDVGYPMYLRLSEWVGQLHDPQYPDGTSDLVDADILSIDWGDGTTSTAPYTRAPRPPLTGQFVTHTYEDYDSEGIVNIVADLNPATCNEDALTIPYTVSIYYFLSQSPSSGGVLVGAPFGIRPIDAGGNALPPDEHFTSVNWGDGTTQPPPYTVDGNGYATHSYAAAGTFTIGVTFQNAQSGATSTTVTAVATQEELDAFNAAYDASQAGQHEDSEGSEDSDDSERKTRRRRRSEPVDSDE